ncbi:ArnT family glycosyltransferase [Spongiimicrobium salis]|uniref:ArnT family glycosyltransferase n=1 Tax=Spongiimicrobium salis TaxID=1667022 RepID=UPI00374CAF0C
MLKKAIHFFTPAYQKLTHRTVLLLLSGIALFVRFPFFFRDYIDRDESTFILLGQSWVEGNLPYTELWDLKPPLVYLFFAGIIAVFGKSFFAIRLVGALMVASTAFFSYKISEQLTSSKKTAFWTAVVCIALQSMFGSLQGVMSEHLCIAFFMPALYLLLQRPKWYLSALSGILMGCSVMIKLNMAYPILFVGLYFLFARFRKKQFKLGVSNALAFGIAIVLVILGTIFPYYLEGHPEIWWKSVILAPLEYSSSKRYSIFKLAPMILVVAMFLFLAFRKKLLDKKSMEIQVLSISILGVLLSFIQGGRINGHYLIQLHPIIIVLVGIVVSKISVFKKFDYRPFVFFLVLLLPMEAYLEYTAIVKNKINKGRFYNGEGIDVPQYLMDNAMDTSNVLFTEYHIGYWVLGTKPLTKAATHPSNICREEIFPFYDNPRKTTMEELRFILEDIQPKTIVTRKNRLVFDKKAVEANTFIDAYLLKHYKSIKTLGKAEIYQRLEQF